MRRRTITIKNEPRIITASQTVTKAKTSDNNIPWGFVNKKFVPVVNASAPPDNTHPQLARLKFTDLPLYVPILPLCKTEKIKDHEVKILHRKVYPYVVEYRKQIIDTITNLMNQVCDEMCKATELATDQKNKFKEYMRHPDNLQMRSAVFASGTIAGFAIGSRKYYLTRGIFWGSVGALFTGWLCFPKESDIAVREISYKVGTTLAMLLSKFCNKTYTIENERLPCFQHICIPTDEYAGNKDCKVREASKNQSKS